MKEVFQEYGGVIVTIIAILSLIAVITAVIGTGEEGIIGSAFADLIDNFLNQAGVSFEGNQEALWSLEKNILVHYGNTF